MRTINGLLVVVAIVAYVTEHPAAARQPACGLACANNNDCVAYDTFTGCSRCHVPVGHNDGKCVPALACGKGFCANNYDCQQNGTCAECDGQQNMCVGGCGQKCRDSAECVSVGCDACEHGLCRKWECGEYCHGDFMCGHNCPYCHDNKCFVRCERACTRSEQCPPPCPHCFNDTCGTWPIVSP